MTNGRHRHSGLHETRISGMTKRNRADIEPDCSKIPESSPAETVLAS